MSATISASGTWTVLDVETANALATGDNRPRLDDQFYEQLALDTGDFNELDQFIDLIAANYGVSHQSALVLLLSLMKIKLGREQQEPAMNNTVGTVGP